MDARMPVLLASIIAAPIAGLAIAAEAVRPLDVNGADVRALDALPGLGRQEAEAIVSFRESHGPFQSLDQLRQVPGVSSRSIDNLRAQLVFGESEFAAMQSGAEPQPDAAKAKSQARAP